MLKFRNSKYILLGTVFALTAMSAASAVTFNIPAGDLKQALDAYSKQAGQPLLYPSSDVSGIHTKGAHGSLSPDAALTAILSNTGFAVHRESGAAVIVRDERTSNEPAQIQFAAATAPTVPGASLETVTVTAQKVKEDIQNVPIAVTALSAEQLQSQKIEGGPDLLKAMPNVTFSKNNFSGYNFSIRGIGTKAVSVTTDPGVAVDFNGTTLIRNRLFEQEYFDVERVEVLRGPQGTLYGRNATSGVINVISATPNLDDFSGSVKGEVGNYGSRRGVGMLNIPLIDDKLAVRLAGSFTIRNGYDIDLYDNTHQDGRNLWSTRMTVGFKPIEQLHGNLIWEHFDENDDRARTGKQLCTHDSGPDTIDGVSLASLTTDNTPRRNAIARGEFSQGCLPGSLYSDAAFGTPNALAIPFINAIANTSIGCLPGCGMTDEQVQLLNNVDPYGDQTQSHDLRALYSQLKPVYRAQADVYELNFDFDLAPSLTLTSQTAYDTDKVYSTQDFNRYTTLPAFGDSNLSVDNNDNSLPSIYNTAKLTPGGVFCDPQLGCSNTIVGEDLSRARSKQFSQEFRLQSNYQGPLNFSAGLDYTHYDTVEDYYVFFNGITLAAINVLNSQVFPFGGMDPSKLTIHPDCSATTTAFGPPLPDGMFCVPIEDNPISNIQDTGHNYFLSRNPYKLDSKAGFGELYWQATNTVKITGGLRYTDDQKVVTPIPSETILSDPARIDAFVPLIGQQDVELLKANLPFSFSAGAYPALPDIHREWKEVTGRFGADWTPKLDFTNQTMVYAFYSRGYKGGGMNPPPIGLNFDAINAVGLKVVPPVPPEFKPEFVNAFEVGSKNTLLDGTLVLNGDVFFYDYKDYQVSKIVDRSAQNENFNARIWGTELESVWEILPGLRFNSALGYLNTALANGSQSIDIMNRTAGHTDWLVLKPYVTFTSNCIAPASVVLKTFLTYPANPTSPLQGLCPGGETPTDDGNTTFYDGTSYNPADHPEANYGAGFYTDVSGHDLPNSPHFTVSLGAQYSYPFSENWLATLRGDYYWQDAQWARIYEDPIDRLRPWENVNVRLTFDKADTGLSIELYVKNVFNATPITDTFTNSDDSALTTNIFTLDPRLIGFSITKTF